MFLAGEWVDGEGEREVVNPWSGEVLDTVPNATPAQVDSALDAAVHGAAEMAGMSGWERSRILNRAAELLEARVEDLARTVSLEEGKPLAEARGEVSRCPELLRLSAFEGAQLRGEVLPLDAAPNGAGKFGLTLRVPCGVVVAITPFNFPMLLVLHKVGPALACGNAVILKPASTTPLVALELTKILLEAGLPPLGLQCVTGDGAALGHRLCADPRVRKITFTGSTAVGEEITRRRRREAAVARAWRQRARRRARRRRRRRGRRSQVATAGYVNAGQVCISTQRVIVERKVYADFLDALAPQVAAIPTGDPFDPATKLAAMISEREAERVESWVGEAVTAGARVVAGGERDGAVHAATVVADVDPSMRMFRDELFGPVVGVTSAPDDAEALLLANRSDFGLSAGRIHARRERGAAVRARARRGRGLHQRRSARGAPT